MKVNSFNLNRNKEKPFSSSHKYIDNINFNSNKTNQSSNQHISFKNKEQLGGINHLKDKLNKDILLFFDKHRKTGFLIGNKNYKNKSPDHYLKDYFKNDPLFVDDDSFVGEESRFSKRKFRNRSKEYVDLSDASYSPHHYKYSEIYNRNHLFCHRNHRNSNKTLVENDVKFNNLTIFNSKSSLNCSSVHSNKKKVEMMKDKSYCSSMKRNVLEEKRNKKSNSIVYSNEEGNYKFEKEKKGIYRKASPIRKEKSTYEENKFPLSSTKKYEKYEKYLNSNQFHRQSQLFKPTKQFNQNNKYNTGFFTSKLDLTPIPKKKKLKNKIEKIDYFDAERTAVMLRKIEYSEKLKRWKKDMGNTYSESILYEMLTENIVIRLQRWWRRRREQMKIKKKEENMRKLTKLQAYIQGYLFRLYCIDRIRSLIIFSRKDEEISIKIKEFAWKRLVLNKEIKEKLDFLIEKANLIISFLRRSLIKRRRQRRKGVLTLLRFFINKKKKGFIEKLKKIKKNKELIIKIQSRIRGYFTRKIIYNSLSKYNLNMIRLVKGKDFLSFLVNTPFIQVYIRNKVKKLPFQRYVDKKRFIKSFCTSKIKEKIRKSKLKSLVLIVNKAFIKSKKCVLNKLISREDNIKTKLNALKTRQIRFFALMIMNFLKNKRKSIYNICFSSIQEYCFVIKCINKHKKGKIFRKFMEIMKIFKKNKVLFGVLMKKHDKNQNNINSKLVNLIKFYKIEKNIKKYKKFFDLINKSIILSLETEKRSVFNRLKRIFSLLKMKELINFIILSHKKIFIDNLLLGFRNKDRQSSRKRLQLKILFYINQKNELVNKVKTIKNHFSNWRNGLENKYKSSIKFLIPLKTLNEVINKSLSFNFLSRLIKNKDNPLKISKIHNLFHVYNNNNKNKLKCDFLKWMNNSIKNNFLLKILKIQKAIKIFLYYKQVKNRLVFKAKQDWNEYLYKMTHFENRLCRLVSICQSKLDLIFHCFIWNLRRLIDTQAFMLRLNEKNKSKSLYKLFLRKSHFEKRVFFERMRFLIKKTSLKTDYLQRIFSKKKVKKMLRKYVLVLIRDSICGLSR